MSGWRTAVAAAVMAIGVTAAAQIPHLWAARADRLDHYPGMDYIGAPATYADDAATYWSWMRQAREGRFLFTDEFTPEEHPRNYVNVLFWGLGTASRLTGVDVVTFYAVARVLLGLGLAAVLWRLAAAAFAKPGERLACFAFLLLSSGWEGIASFLERNAGAGHVTSPAWWTPELSTFGSMMLFPHFLAGFIALVGTVLLMLRAWSRDDRPASERRRLALAAGFVMAVLTCFHPYDVVTAMGVVWSGPVAIGLLERRLPKAELSASALATAVWLPAFLYNLWIFVENPAMRAWDLQNIMVTPDADKLVLVTGVSGVLAALGVLVFRRMSRVHAVMLGWFVSEQVIIHLPLRFQRRMIGGIQFPLAVLAIFGLATLLAWARRRAADSPSSASGAGVLLAAASLMPLQIATPYYLLDIEWGQVRGVRYPAWIRSEESAGLRALATIAPPESRIVSSYAMGNFIPPFSGRRCVLGHYALTIDAKAKQEDLERFFSGEADDAFRIDRLRRWSARYVFHSRHEREIGPFDPTSRPWLREVFRSGDDPANAVAIYEVEPGPRPTP